MSKLRRHEPAVQSVTTAPTAAEEELHARIKHYLWTMGVRTGCFLLAFLTEGWIRWTCVVLAAVLPYVAVVFANAHAPRTPGRVGAVMPRNPGRRRLGR